MSEPRGERLNNPTNIRRVAGQVWIGQSATQADASFVSFTSPQYGYRASDHIIRRGYKPGETTVADVISHWAPPTENDTKGYIAAVEKRMAIGAGSVLTLPEQMPELLHAITVQELGFCPYSDSVIMAGIELDGVKTMTKVELPPPLASKIPAVVSGGIKSKTMWASVVLLVLSNLAPVFPQICAQLGIDAHTTQVGGTLLALLMGYLRSMTSQSLADKVSPLPQPPENPK